MPPSNSFLQAAPVPISIDLTDSFGPLLVGAMVCFLLYGATICQTILYFINFPKDMRHLTNLVFINLALCTILIIATCEHIYTPLIRHFGNVQSLAVLTWGARTAPLLTAVLIFIIQGFFLVRVFRFSKKWYLLAGSSPFVFATLGLGLVSAIQVIRNPSEAATAKLKNVNLANDALLIATDLWLAGLMAIFLYRSRMENSVAKTNTVIRTLIAYAVGTGMLTGLLALVGLIVRLAAPNTTVNECMYSIIPQMYSNALLANLNLRRIATKLWEEKEVVQLSDLRFTSGMQPSRTDGDITDGTTTKQSSVLPAFKLSPEKRTEV